MRLSELLKETDVEISDDREIVELTDNAAAVRPGWGYVCRVGTQYDGHAFAAEAAKRGAAAIFTERPLGLDGEIHCRSTADLWPRLCAARFGYPAKDMIVMGVTGTNGKTSTCTLLHAMLTAAGHKVGQLGTVENRVGGLSLPAAQTTPGSYELQRALAVMRDAGCTHAVMEVSSHALAQKRADGMRFAVGGFTNLTQDHLDYHRTIEGYAAAKKRLFSLCDAAVVNADDRYAAYMTEGFSGRVITTSCRRKAAVFAENIRFSAAGAAFTLGVGERRFETRIPLPGLFSVANTLTALGMALAAGEAVDLAVQSLPRLPTVPGRAEIIARFRGATVMRDYAHTPDGIWQIGQAARTVTNGRLILLFGCGGDRDRTKRPLMGKAAAAVADFVLLTSDNPRSEDPRAILRQAEAGLKGSETPYRVILRREDAIAAGLAMLREGDLLLLAGKGHESTQTLADRTVRFDERAIVRRWMDMTQQEEE